MVRVLENSFLHDRKGGYLTMPKMIDCIHLQPFFDREMGAWGGEGIKKI
jgi:hypothetical protein